MITDYSFHKIKGHRSVAYGFRCDILQKNLFDMVEQEGKNTLFAFKMPINGRFGDTDFRGNRLDRQVFAAVLENQDRRCIDYLLLPDLRVFPFLYQCFSPVKRLRRISG